MAVSVREALMCVRCLLKAYGGDKNSIIRNTLCSSGKSGFELKKKIHGLLNRPGDKLEEEGNKEEESGEFLAGRHFFL